MARHELINEAWGVNRHAIEMAALCERVDEFAEAVLNAVLLAVGAIR